jgi:hypothetical protein
VTGADLGGAPASLAPRPVHRLRTDCRGCGSAALHRFLELGPSPLANAFLRSPAEFAAEAKYPLDVYFCDRCALVQVLDVIDPEVLFRNYIYATSQVGTMARHNAAYAETVTGLLGLGGDDLVVEVASNNGALLQQFRARGVRTLGIEPATNIAAMADAAGIPTVNEFFDADCGPRIRAGHGPARAVIGNNVLAHVDDTRGFLRGARGLVADDGLVIVEVPYLGEFLDRLEYDTVYHEHLCYFSVTALMGLCESVDLSLVRVDRVPVHGGSIRIYAAPRIAAPSHAAPVAALADDERRQGMTSRERFDRFAADVRANRRALVGTLERLRAEGRSLAAYGAPAKGNTLLNYCAIGTELVPYTVDRSPLKVGCFTPGMHLPVLPVETLRERRPDVVLLLAWNFAEEILQQEEAYRRAGGRFLLPLPTPTLVS